MSKRHISIAGDEAHVPLNTGDIAIIDVADAGLVDGHQWYLSKTGYVRRTDWSRGVRGTVDMHRLVIDCPAGKCVDHIDGNKLNNRRHNLRVATPSLNGANRSANRGSESSRFKGVTWSKSSVKWQAQIKSAGVKRYLGLFETESDAHEAYVRAARELFGEFARSE